MKICKEDLKLWNTKKLQEQMTCSFEAMKKLEEEYWNSIGANIEEQKIIIRKRKEHQNILSEISTLLEEKGVIPNIRKRKDYGGVC